MKSKKEEIIEILKYEAQLQDTEDYTDHEIVNIDEIAERIVKLFAIPDVNKTFYCVCANPEPTTNTEGKPYCNKCGFNFKQ